MSRPRFHRCPECGDTLEAGTTSALHLERYGSCLACDADSLEDADAAVRRALAEMRALEDERDRRELAGWLR